MLKALCAPPVDVALRSLTLMRTKKEIEADKRRLRAKYGRLFDDLAEILFRHDPMGINFEENTDEYEPEARTILPRLKTCHSPDDVLKVVHEEFQKWFGADIAGSRERYKDIAQEVWILWRTSRSPGAT